VTSFTELGLARPLLQALEGEGYVTPTPIQVQAIPVVLKGTDLLGIAQTGTGKTAAFALPILHRLAADPRPAPRRGCRVLVLSPTRELATQIADSFRSYGRHLSLTTTVVFGGVGHRPQIQALARGVDVLVATPGRLLDHLGERNAAIEGTEILVLDEADQMLDLGFIKPIRRIVSNLSGRRQTLFFSATMPPEIAGLAKEFLRDPVKVAVTPAATTVERITQRVIHVEAPRKRSLLAALLADANMSRTLVFTRTKRGADRVAQHLDVAGISAAAIHGNKSQRQREMALEDFRAGTTRVLVATDIAARGLDIPDVTHVVNYELPEIPESYVHRIGRTARAGASGSAISLCDGEERDLLRRIERLTRQTIPQEDRRNDTTLQVSAEPQRSRHERGGRRSESRPGRGDRAGDERGSERFQTRQPRERAERGAPAARPSRDSKHASGGQRGEHRGAEPREVSGNQGWPPRHLLDAPQDRRPAQPGKARTAGPAHQGREGSRQGQRDGRIGRDGRGGSPERARAYR
jgi:ATP-dependent RNA helicase RhlE